MKRIISLLLVLCLVLSCGAAVFAEGIGVTIDGTAVEWTDVEPFIDSNNRTLCPLRAVGEALGLTVDWDNDAREAIFIRTEEKGSVITKLEDGTEVYVSETRLVFPIDSSTAQGYVLFKYCADDSDYLTVNVPVAMDTAAIISNSRTYAPVRYLAESFGYLVDWDAETRTVLILSQSEGEEEAPAAQ